MIALIETILGHRSGDKWGQGHFGAPRGDRTHNGIDYACDAESEILSPVSGMVTKIGYPYADDLSFRYVQITDSSGADHRVFYVDPSVFLNQGVRKNFPIGLSQKLSDRYPGITEHIHYEIKVSGRYVDPEGDVA